MMRSISLRIAALLTVLALPAAMSAQAPQQAAQDVPPLYIRLAGPTGMKVTIYRSGPKGQTLDTPCVVAFRPGYRYRIELTGLPDRVRPRAAGSPVPTFNIYPTLDVLGSLRLTDGMRASNYPASIVLTEDDLMTILAGSLVTKVIVLERPEIALPVATTSTNPIEITVPPNRNPVEEAQYHGRPLVVMHVGERQASAEELLACAVPGTVLLPGEKVLPPPRDPPCLPWICYSLVDPRSGLPSPCDEICFHDGGDIGLRAGIGPDGKLVGLDASDTVAEYMNSRGEVKIAVSNKVCLCVPRYLLVRTALTPLGNTVSTGVGDTRIAQAPAQSQIETAPVAYLQENNPVLLLSRQKLSGIVNFQQTQVVGRIESLAVYANAEGTGHVTGACEVDMQLTEKPLIIWKWPDKCDLLIGDLVTFYIRYKNQGQRPITGIVISDSLTARLEYVPGTARTDRDALFTTTPNEVDSTVLRWGITVPLQPGQTGIVTFQAKIR